MSGAATQVTRFKLDDGREGSKASLGDGLTKLLFDDGDMIIVSEAPPALADSETNAHNTMTEEN